MYIFPHLSNTSVIIDSVILSGKPPTNTVLQPLGLSRVVGGGAEGGGGYKVHDAHSIISVNKIL